MQPLSERLTANEAEAVDLFRQRLLSEFGRDVTDMRLFGSWARGDAGADSDIDILIIVQPPDYALKHAILWLAAEVSLAFGVLLSPRVVPLSAWQKMSEGDTLLYRTVCAEGFPLTAPVR